MTSKYIYGVTHSTTTLPAPVTGIAGAPVTLVTHDRCGALVSDLPADRPTWISARSAPSSLT
jgi:hypothetical protein